MLRAPGPAAVHHNAFLHLFPLLFNLAALYNLQLSFLLLLYLFLRLDFWRRGGIMRGEENLSF